MHVRVCVRVYVCVCVCVLAVVFTGHVTVPQAACAVHGSEGRSEQLLKDSVNTLTRCVGVECCARCG